MLSRTAGVLLPLSALPGPYGCGVLGEEAIAFAARMRQAGLHCWQILPSVQPGAGNSPYTSISAFAGNLWYLDPRHLVKDGLLTEAEAALGVYPGEPYRVDYDWLRENRLPLLRRAYARASAEQQHQAEEFAEEHAWVEEYACFMALRERYSEMPYWQWPDAELRMHDPEAVKKFAAAHREQTGFWRFMQLLFYRQWMQLKAELEAMGIALIGDMPIYVALDSADTWAHPELFLLEQPGKPLLVAGTPPDYFSEDGQLWGNPLYDWKAMAEENYHWWIERLRWQLELCHSVRIDHFRAFESFWAIPAQKARAIEGQWMSGPGMALFDAVRQELGEVPVIAEDLGLIDEKVRAFLQKTGFPGMRVLQFAFTPGTESLHLPHCYTQNCVAYTGTHDNNTALGYLWEAAPDERAFALAYCGAEDADWGKGGPQAPGVRALLRAVWQSPAALAIAPVQDLCGFGADTRINIPGKAKGNWCYRLTSQAMASIDCEWMARLCRLYARDHAFLQKENIDTSK